jgi:hypothetical protein
VSTVNDNPFVGSVTAKAYHFEDYDLIYFYVYINRIQYLHEALVLDTSIFGATRTFLLYGDLT